MTSETTNEQYLPMEKAEFLLNNAVTDDDVRWAEEEIRKMGLDPVVIRSSRSVTDVL
ncbi:MAG: hypothetical protein ACYDDN_11945 [Candidatus Desulforudaceae bacterium]|jgi:hypothetical protein